MLTQLHLMHDTERVMRSPTIPLTPVTLLVGPNGSGKSTLLSALKELILNPRRKEWTRETAPVLVDGDARGVYFLSFELDNPRTVNLAMLPDRTYGAALDARFKSHGQSNHKLLQEAFAAPELDVLVFDEPESALDLDGLLLLRQAILATDKQVILATHNPLLLTLLGQEGVSAQVFGPDPDYPQRVLQVYLGALGKGKFPKPQKRLALFEARPPRRTARTKTPTSAAGADDRPRLRLLSRD